MVFFFVWLVWFFNYYFYVELEEGHPTCSNPGGCGAAPAFRDHPPASKVREVLLDKPSCDSGPICNGPGLGAGSVRAPGAEPVLTALGGPTAAPQTVTEGKIQQA